MTAPPDRRIAAHRPDLADRRLEGLVAAGQFVEGERWRIALASVPLRAAPRPDLPFETEALRGEVVRVFEETIEGWAWGQIETDGYVGYFSADALGPLAPEPTHRVIVPRTFLYPAPDLRRPPREALSLGATLALGEAVETRGTLYRMTADGAAAVVDRHVAPLDAPHADDWVAVAEGFLGAPYLWGGRTSLGLDCSALVQLSLAACGIAAPRDSDLQESAVGRPAEGPPRRGDLVFWPGHVGLVAADETLLHASGFQMQVVREPLAGAIARIGAPRSIRRL
ncbi:NlpC/P60 family protein [Prosthecomicrobium pneumaticum]|uniref:Cell wall-associated NlpC family hydrolase n=1 Tax=Prosthecomicrobium pneumaticum TaxID=81895 RepID=A0A7W9FNF8_9HYPH|nr:NlpC/P60 family protein [Prosthecomicrobium pneumaticum]MBB5753925.1 cell wall-associated NlpC family hydrolase [Prosthecomicrobium pneumaticum]